ncbi:MAG: OmpA family protein [Saprospiraceae bacterium]
MKKIIILFKLCWLAANCLVAQNALSPDIKVEVKNEETVNTGSLEFSPAFYENGIVFISDNQEGINSNRFTDKKIAKETFFIFLSRRAEEGGLKAAGPFAEELTTQWHEGPLTFNKTNDKVFFSRNDFLDGKVDKASDGIVKQMIISADMAGGKWSNPQRLPFNNKEFDFVHPSINVDDNVLYFSSDRPGGFGGMDIWKVEKSGTSWGVPVNLGPGINTASNEVFTFIHADGTLFFSSNGHGSKGGGDIFFSKPLNGEYASPVNLGNKFNTNSDDFGFIIDRDKKNGYLSSNREGGKGQDDIYSFFIDEALGEDIFQYPENHPAFLASNGAINQGGNGGNGTNPNAPGDGFGNQILTLFVADRLTGTELGDAVVEYVDLAQLTNTEIVTDENGNVIQLVSSEDGSVVTLSTVANAVKGTTDAEGAYNLKLGDGNYLVNITKPGYKPKQILVTANNQGELLALMDQSTNCATINGVVYNSSNNAVPGAKITIQKEGDLTLLDVTSDASGNFSVCLECGRSYIITVAKNGKTTSENVAISADCNGGRTQTMSFNLDVGGLVGGTTIRLERIYYNFNDAAIRPDARDELNTLVSILNNYPTLEIEIASHTDSRGENSYNRQLSQRRADKVVAYLVQQGISARRLTPRGYGESNLLNQCYDGTECSELDHQYNRRTEIIVKEFNDPVGVEYVSNAPESVDNAPTSVTSGGGSYSSGNSDSDYGGGSGRYQVVAGSFSSRTNAENRLSRIQQLGFDDAKVIRVSGVASNIVLIRTFSDYNQARELADEIENVHNINTYVKRGR